MKRLDAVLLVVALAGCADTPSVPQDSTAGEPGRVERREPPSRAPVDVGARIASAAQRLVGSPYRYGGTGPREFDCSGLVSYVHAQAGIDVPRTAAEQFLHARRVSRSSLQPGDLVFFRTSGTKISHVGVYTGKGLFVHAPQSGRPVEYGNLHSDYHRVNFAGAGRLHRSD